MTCSVSTMVPSTSTCRHHSKPIICLMYISSTDRIEWIYIKSTSIYIGYKIHSDALSCFETKESKDKKFWVESRWGAFRRVARAGNDLLCCIFLWNLRRMFALSMCFIIHINIDLKTIISVYVYLVIMLDYINDMIFIYLVFMLDIH